MRNKVLFFSLLLFTFITVIWIDFSANATFDAGDGIQHYLIAKYSWKQPQLLLDMWGKPVFTLVSSPFAQFGLKGMCFFQALCSVFTTILLYKIAEVFKLKYRWTLTAFVFFSPIYFAVINSGLTEILFATMLILTFWLAIKKRFIACSIVASFIPFVRPEGYLVLSLLAVLFVLKKKWRALPFLFTSFLIYTIAGYPSYHDLLWIITNNYKLNDDTYKGMEDSFFHYFTSYSQIWGTLYSVFLVAGIITIISSLRRLKRDRNRIEFIEEKTLLIFGSFFSFLLLYSISCSVPGFINNLGMLRYMVTLIPLSAIISLMGLNGLLTLMQNKSTPLQATAVCLSVGFIILAPFQQWYFPFRSNNEETVINQTANWLKPFIRNKHICFLHPYFAVAGEIDPFDKNKTTLISKFNRNFINRLPDSTYIIWDSHFCPQEGRTPLDSLLSDGDVIPIRNFCYYLTSENFETWIFLKTKVNSVNNYSFTIETVADRRLLNEYYKVDSVYFDFRSMHELDSNMIHRENNRSGKFAVYYSHDREYGPLFSRSLKEMSDYSNLGMIKATFKIFPSDSVKNIITVTEIKKNNKIISWNGYNLPLETIRNRWNSVQMIQFFHPEVLDENCDVNFYFWNKGGINFLLDSVRGSYYNKIK